MLPCSVNSARNMAPFHDSSLDPDKSFSPSREAFNCPRTLNLHYHSYYPMPSPPFSLPNFNYDSLFTPDTLPVHLPYPDPDPEATEEFSTIPAAEAVAPATTPRRKATSCRRRRFRTDRHSKIHTSQGLRDRRMRLSLGVARHFFRLQDILGFDKASHTIDWLLKESKPAIDLLSRSSVRFDKQAPNGGSFVVAESSASECEVISSASHHNKIKPTKAKGALGPAPRKTVGVDGRFRRDSRAKARARARERTIEKKKFKGEESNTLGLEVLDGLMTSEVSNEANGCSDMSMVSSWLMCCNEETGSKETGEKQDPRETHPKQCGENKESTYLWSVDVRETLT